MWHLFLLMHKYGNIQIVYMCINNISLFGNMLQFKKYIDNNQVQITVQSEKYSKHKSCLF